MKSIRWSVIALLAVAVAVLPLQGKVARATPVIEVSQPVQITSDSHYERGQSVAFDGADYWLFYGRSDTVTGNYDNANPDTHDYEVYFQKASSVPDLASATPTLISGVAHNANSYLGETGAAYFDSDVWAFATIDVGATAELYGWYTSDGGSSWTEVGPIVTGLSDGQAHHDEVAFDGELWVVEGSGDFTTTHSATPKAGGWSGPVVVDSSSAVTGGLAHFFVEGSDLYLAVYSNGKNYVYEYNSGTGAWAKVDEIAPPEKYDPTLFKVDSTYVFAQAPWVSDGTPGGRQYIIAWSNGDLDGTFFDGAHSSVTEGEYGANSWVDMWPIGFTDAGGDTYLLYTSERDQPTAEGTGNIWYLKWDWDPANDHYTYIQEAIDGAGAGDTINVAAGTYNETLRVDGTKASNVSVLGADKATTSITGGVRFEGSYTGLAVENFTITGDGRQRPGLAEATIGASSSASVVTDARFTNNILDGEGITGVGGGRFGAYLSSITGSFAFENNEVKNYRGWGTVELNQASHTVTSYVFNGNSIHDNSGSSALRGNPSDRTDTVTVTGNAFDNNGGGDSWASLEVNEAETVTVSDNSITNTQAGGWGEGEALQFWHITSLALTGNVIEDNYQGIYFPGDAWASDLSGVEIHGNSISGNTQFGLQADAGNTGTADASANWWGTNTPAGVAGQVSDDVDSTPWLDEGTDTEPGTPGFQGSFSTLDVDDDSPQTGTSGRIQEAIDLVSGSTVNVAPGTYTGTIDVDSRSDIEVVGADRDTVIVQPGSTLSWALPGYPQYDSRQAAVRVVGSTDIDFSNMTFDFDTVKGNLVHGVFYWDSTGVINNNVLKNMTVPDASGGYYEITSYIRAPSYSDGARADVTITNNEFLETGRLGVVTHDFVEANIAGNTFTKTTDDFGYAIELGSRSTGTISGNTISGYDTPAASDGSTAAGIYIENSYTGGLPHVNKPVTVSGNTLAGNQYGLWIGNEYDGYAGDVDISVTLNGNDIVDNVDGGVYVVDEDREAGSSVTLTASGNTVSSNGSEGYHFFTYRDGEIHAVVSGDTISGQQTGVLVDECVDEGPDDMCPEGASASLYDVVIGPDNDISGNDNGVFLDSVSGVVISGNEIHHNLNRPGYAGVGIMLWGDNDDNQILGNVVHDNDRQGIFVGHDTLISTGNTISGNTVYNNGLYTYPNGPDASAYGIQLWNADNCDVTNNEVYGHDDWFAYPDFDFAQGIYLHESNDNLLSGNDLHDNNYGVGLWGPGRADGSNLINFNSIAGNTGFGVRSFDTVTVNAENNWWGACDGPSSVGPGSGDAVSTFVDYDPWLHGGCDTDGDGLADDQEELVIGTDWLNPDTDGDGCSDGLEYVAMEGFDPRAPYWYDFYDVPVPANPDMTPNGPRDQAVTMGDVLAVLLYVGAYDGDGGAPNPNGLAYDSIKGSCDVGGDTVMDKEGLCYDRTPSAPPDPPREAGPPNGAVTMGDVLAVLAQVGLSCVGEP